MSDYERLLISKAVDQEDIVPAMSAGVRVDWFEGTDHRQAWRWMVEYFNRYGTSPTEGALHDQFPAYRVSQRIEEPYDYYVDRLRDQRSRTILVDTIIDADSSLKEGDHREAQEHLSGGLLRLGQEITSLTDQNVVEDLDGRYRRYIEAKERAGKLTGITTGFPTLDRTSGGWQAQQFVLFGGQPKQGKSFILMKSAVAAQEHNKKVLFISFEMSVDEQEARYDALTCGVNALHLINGNVSEEEFKKLRMGMKQRRNMASFVISADVSAHTTVSALAGKIEQHRPDIVFVDGVYLMDGENGEPGTPQAYTSISRGLKRLAQRIECPVIGTTQALSSKMKNDRVTMHSLGWTSAWAQDADIIMGVEKIDGAPMINLRVVAARNIYQREIMIHCNWDESYLEEVESGDGEDE